MFIHALYFILDFVNQHLTKLQCTIEYQIIAVHKYLEHFLEFL